MLKKDDAYFEGLDFRNGEDLYFTVEGEEKIEDSATDQLSFAA